MSKHTFILSDESLNSYGQIVLTKGIDIKRFEKNPVMLYMHERKNVIGRWDNIRKEGNKLLADAIFDENLELSKTIKNQVDSGILRAVSIGVTNAKIEVIKGIETVMQCELNEVSIVDIPANENAIKLRNKSKVFKFMCLTKLSKEEQEQEQDSDKNDILSRVIEFLGLDEDCTEEDIFNALKALKTGKSGNVPEYIANAVQLNLISQDDVEFYQSAGKSYKTDFERLCNKMIAIEKTKINDLVEKSFDEGRFLQCDKQIFTEIGIKIGVEKLKQLIELQPDRTRISSLVHSFVNPSNEHEWNLQDYRKFAPEKLKDNPALYAQLIKNEGVTDIKQGLEWYRKNNPEFLKSNPDAYKRLVNSELNK